MQGARDVQGTRNVQGVRGDDVLTASLATGKSNLVEKRQPFAVYVSCEVVFVVFVDAGWTPIGVVSHACSVVTHRACGCMP